MDIELEIKPVKLPREIEKFLREADERVYDYLEHSRVRHAGFVPSDFVTVYQTMRALVQKNLMTGDTFLEWGSGFGVVASLASMMDFEAYGIEIELPLVESSRELAEDFELSVEFTHGSFIPPGCEDIVDAGFSTDPFWLECESDNAYHEMGLFPDDFDVIFTYPWPSEEDVIGDLFDQCAARDALLLTYTQTDHVRVRRKVR